MIKFNFYWSVLISTIFLVGLGIVLPILIPRGPNRPLIRLMLVMTAICCYLLWSICYIAQLHPLIGPVLSKSQILIVTKFWGQDNSFFFGYT